MRRGWTDSSSLARGHGASADQPGRLRYVANLDEMIAQEFADLQRWGGELATHDGEWGGDCWDLLLDDLQLLHENRRQLLHQVRSIPRIL